MKGTHTGAARKIRINEACSGSATEMGYVGQAIERAEDKTAQRQARAGAIDELLASGALDEPGALGRGDDISRELEAMSSDADVEKELAALKSGKEQAALPAASEKSGDGSTAGTEPALDVAAVEEAQPTPTTSV